MKNLFLYLFLFSCFFVSAQIEIDAQILNKTNDEPVEFASVLILDIFEGTISDSLGFFNLTVDQNGRKIAIQSLGYLSDTFTIIQLQNKAKVYLEPTNYRINDVVVYPQNAFEIVQRAVAKIPENYDAATVAQNVYYKQSIIANNELLSLQEANFDALVKFKNDNANLVSIKKARAFIDIDTLKSLGKMVTNQLDQFDSTNIRENASQYFNMDFMLSEELGEDNTSLFSEKAYKNYKYSYNGMVEKDGYYAYHITFDQVDDIKKSLFKGHFYIDTATLAFFDANVYLSPKGIKYQKVIPKSVTLLAKLFGYSIYVNGLDYYVHYKKVDGKWVLDIANSKLAARVAKRNGPTFDGYLTMNFVVNSFYLKEGFYNKKSNYDVLKSDKNDFLDENFWGNLYHKPLSSEEKKLIKIQ